jgi:type VI secretion system protein ImpM
MEVGLYGKLPTHGDFLRRRVADDFVDSWDPWLQRCIAESRAALGERWLELYLTSPVWRFVLSANACGGTAVAGLMVPSIDKVGRYFPLVLVWPKPPELSCLEVAVKYQPWFDRAERLLLDTLEAEILEFADFDQRVMDSAACFDEMQENRDLMLDPSAAQRFAGPLRVARCIPLQSAGNLQATALQVYGRVLDEAGTLGLWWTDGSAAVEPCWLMTPGLPAGSQFSAMLDGRWRAAGWEHNEVARSVIPPATVVPSGPAKPPYTFVSSALSDRGLVRANNQDAFIERPDLSLWAIADGMGGLSEGELASRMVCDALADMTQMADLDAQVEAVLRQLRDVNGCLRRNAVRPLNPVHSGSTVAVLLMRQSRCAVVWAGDSRAYRWRNGELLQLTVDHSWAADGAYDLLVGGVSEETITRAVGGEDDLVPEMVYGEVFTGDRFLLCTDGVHKFVDAQTIKVILASDAPAVCCKKLIGAAAAAGGSDNATAVVVDCTASEMGLVQALDIFST